MTKKLSYTHYLKNLKLIERNTEWLAKTGISQREKIAYYGRIPVSIVGNQRKVKYLGNTLYYDNPATPLNLQNYPYEISHKILANMGAKPKTVLDIGGNIGQFSLTINHILKEKAKIDVFEPNSYVFEYLQKNASNCKNITTFNYGLGSKREQKTLYFNPSRTGIGSLHRKNAGEGVILRQNIAITNKPEDLTQRTKYDLVKIDVEGYEFHAIAGLKNIVPKYLFIELSGQGRSKDYMHSDMFSLIEKQWGRYDIHYLGRVDKKQPTFDVLLHFKEKNSGKK